MVATALKKHALLTTLARRPSRPSFAVRILEDSVTTLMSPHEVATPPRLPQASLRFSSPGATVCRHCIEFNPE